MNLFDTLKYQLNQSLKQRGSYNLFLKDLTPREAAILVGGPKSYR